jgi:hypothetical protein
MPSISISAQVRTDLAAVSEKLEAAIGSLTGSGRPGAKVSVGSCCGLLREAAGLLEKVQREGLRAPADAILVDLLERVQARSARVQLLLDSAAALSRGRLLAWPSPELDYTPEGAWARVSAPVRLRVEA